MSRIDEAAWGRALRLALSLGLSPEQFWALSLREWLSLQGAGLTAPSRNQLRDLMARFPDGEKDER